mgnify:CR=1 FL=1
MIWPGLSIGSPTLLDGRGPSGSLFLVVCISGFGLPMFGALMQAGNLGLPNEAYGDAFRVTFAKKPKLIPKNLEILDAGAGAARVLAMAARK